MNCETVREQLSAWSDGQLELQQASAIDGHLATCHGCRAASEVLREQDAQLRRAFRSPRLAAQRVAGQVVQRLELEPAPLPPTILPPRTLPPRTPWAASRWGSLLLASAGGFLLAVLLFQPWKLRPQVVQPLHDSPEVDFQPAPVAQLVVATGTVEVRQPGQQSWQSSAGSAAFRCPPGSAVRTGPNVQCELKTNRGGVIRLNDETQIKLAAGDTIEIESGQIWCSSPDGMAMNVLAPATASPPAPAGETWALACQSDACMLTAVERDGGAQVTTAAGEIDVQTPSAHQRLKPGESVSIVKGAIIKTKRTGDPLLCARWTLPLLVRKGYDNRELTAYVDQLLARVGRAKLATLYEQDIRSLGEYAALPLLRFVQSPLSQNDALQRHAAMRIVSDIAPGWAMGDLIQLLADRDAETRFVAARTLKRLTGLDQGRAPDAWREDLNDCLPAIERWQRWWAENQKRYPPPAPSGSSA